jgi:hypothetical protein
MFLLRELLGWIGTSLVLYSFLFSDMKRIRMYNAFGSVFWILFGIETNELPIVFLNVIIFLIHLRWFMKEDLLFPKKDTGDWKDVETETKKWLSGLKHEPTPKEVIQFMSENYKGPVKK